MLSPRSHNFISYAGSICFYIYFSNISLASVLLFRDNYLKKTGLILWILHFARRCVETCLLFKFSKKVVPIDDSITEFVYYWAFASWIAHSCPSDSAQPDMLSTLGVTIWFIAEVLNCFCHFKLAMNNDKKKRLRGFPLFSSITMPHYLFEITSWIGFNTALRWRSTSGILFMLVGGFIMLCWAIEKHSEYAASTKHTPLFFGIDLRPPKTIVKALAK